jgi:xanthine dehydrogenase large subunit
MDNTTFEAKTTINGPMHASLRHDSAHKHVTGTAEYIDDMPEPAGTLHAALGMADRAHADILSIDLSAVRSAPGVVAVLTADDIPGVNDVSSNGSHDEPLLATDKVEFHGQPIFVVIGETREAARRAARLANIEYRDPPH